MSLESHLRGLRDSGRKVLAPYLTAGFPSPGEFADVVVAMTEAGADLLEIGIPFSDPVMDGPIIQRASAVALEAEMRPDRVLATMGSLNVAVPFVFMTYVNPVLAMGYGDFAKRCADAGATGVIIPDLPPEEAALWLQAAATADIAPIFLAAPTTTPERMRALIDCGNGFVYCVSLLGVTGTRASLSDRAREVVAAVRTATDRPALLGVGVSTPEHAVEACSFADGVIVGSAVIDALAKFGPKAAADLVAQMRTAIDN